jgi:hypothetical protein
MSKAAKAQEPSMEEILASIRRIIADDEAGKPSPPAAPPLPAPAAPSTVIRAFPEPAVPIAASEPTAMNQNDIDAMLAGFDAEPQAATAAAPGGDVLELTEAMEAKAVASNAQPGFRTVEAGADVVFGEASAPLPEVPPAAYAEEQSGLLSGHTTAAVTSAFGTLAHTVLVQNARTLEDLVREMLRPMLKAWLDDNLPTIVERQVRAEIERVSRG